MTWVAATTPLLLQRDCKRFGAEQKVAAAVAYVQQRGCGDFTGPSRARPGRTAWCVPAIMSGRHPLMAVEDVLQVAVLLPPSGSNGLVCSCCCVRSATAYGGGGCALPRGCGTTAPCLLLSLFSLTGLVAFAMVRR